MLPQCVKPAARLYLLRAQLVFVGIVAVDTLLAQCGIAVALPTAAQVQLVVDSPYAVAATYHQSQGIILAIAGVWYLQFAQHRCVECAWGAQTVYSQGVVAAVLRCPFAMVYQSGRQGFQTEVAHAVAAYHHGSVLREEHVHHPLQRVRAAVEVIAVQLHHEASHSGVVYRRVPASAYAQVVALGDDVDHSGVAGIALHHLGRTVGGTVVHHHQVVVETRLLAQHAFYGIGYGPHAVAYGNHHSGLHVKFRTVLELDGVELPSMQICVDGAQVSGARPFQFHLAGSVAWVHIVELLLPGQPCVAFNLRVEIFAYVYRQLFARQEQAQVVERGISVAVQLFLGAILLQDGPVDEQEAAHLEVVPHAAFLVVDQRHGLALAGGKQDVVVRIHHQCVVVPCYGKHAVQGMEAQLQGVVLGIEQNVGCLGCLGDILYRLGAAYAIGQVMNLGYVVVAPQYVFRFSCLAGIGLRNKAVYVFGHVCM